MPAEVRDEVDDGTHGYRRRGKAAQASIGRRADAQGIVHACADTQKAMVDEDGPV